MSWIQKIVTRCQVSYALYYMGGKAEGQTLVDEFLLGQMAMPCNSIKHLGFVAFEFLTSRMPLWAIIYLVDWYETETSEMNFSPTIDKTIIAICSCNRMKWWYKHTQLLLGVSFICKKTAYTCEENSHKCLVLSRSLCTERMAASARQEVKRKRPQNYRVLSMSQMASNQQALVSCSNLLMMVS